jgi:hypothetical protein
MTKFGQGIIPDIEPTPVPTPIPTPVPVTPVLPPFPVNGTFQQILAWLAQVWAILHPTQATAATHDVMGKIPWQLVVMLLSDSAVIAPIIIADIQAGKSWSSILTDAINALKGRV